MKNILLIAAATFLCLAANAQPTHPASPHDTLSTQDMTVTYGRPYKKGRAIFGSLEPYGKVYRCGADEATTITLKKDAIIAGKSIPAGTYTLFVIPYETKWTLILNGQLGQWGAYDYDKYKDQDRLTADLPVKNLSQPVEQLTMRSEDHDLIIEWDLVQVRVPVSYH